MANSLTKVEQIAWEEGCEAAENTNVFAQNAEVYKPDSGMSELAGQTVRIPYANQIEISRGEDVTGSEKDMIDLSVPISLAKADIYNGVFKASATERLVERRIKDNTIAAIRRISSEVSKDIANLVSDKGTLVGAETSNLTDYKHFAKAEAMFSEIELDAQERFMYLGPRTSLGVSNELAMRPTDNSRDHSAYSASKLPDIGTFQVFKTNALKQITAAGATAIATPPTVDGDDQDVTPVAYNSDGGYAAGSTDDIRTQTLLLNETTMTNGDCFTIAGVNRLGQDSKTDTGQLMTFRVISGGGTASLTISPAMVVSGAYANVTAAPDDGAVVTVINTDTAEPTIFTTKEAVTLYCSDLEMKALGGSGDVVLGTYTTSSGLSIAMIRQGKLEDLSAKYRFSVWAKPNIVRPDGCGILLPNQNAAI